MEQETWKDIEGYEGRYKISSHGTVASFSKACKYGGVRDRKNPLIRKQHINSNGYFFVKLQKHGVMKTIDTHILVARHFIPNPNNLAEVNHLKGKLNNYYKDLEWCSSSDNQLHAYRTGLKRRLKHEQNPKAILTKGQVIDIANSTKTQKQLAEEYMVSPSAINCIKNGYSWTEITGRYPGWKKNL